MAIGTTDRSLTHVIDMAPDSWLASEAAAKLARGVGDCRTEALALCIAARQAVPLCGALLKREWDMAHNNDWEWKTQLPELGYFDSSHVNATRWDDSQLSASGIVGMIHSPALLRMYREFCPGALRVFLARMEEAYPQWADWRYVRPGKKEGQNGPTAFYRQLLLRDALGEPTGELEKLFRAGLFDDNEFSVWTRNVAGRSTIVGFRWTGAPSCPDATRRCASPAGAGRRSATPGSALRRERRQSSSNPRNRSRSNSSARSNPPASR